MLHGFSADEMISLTLDLRAADAAAHPCRNLVIAETLNRLLDDLRGGVGSPAPVEVITDYLRQLSSPVFSLSMRLDQSLFSHTNPNGMCGYILAYQLHQRATATTTEGYSPAPLDLGSSTEQGRLSAFLYQLAASSDDFAAAVASVTG